MPTPHTLSALLSDPSYAPEAIARIVRAYEQAGGATRGAAAALGLRREATLHEWRRRFPDLDDAVRETQIACDFARSGGRPKKDREST